MSTKTKMSIPGNKAIIGGIEKGAIVTMQKVFEAMDDQVLAHDLYPQLNQPMVDAGPGAYFSCVAVGEVVKDAVPSALSPGNTSDSLLVQGIKDGVKLNFYAGNKGMKAKLNGIKKGTSLMIVFEGDLPSETKGYSDFHNFRVFEFKTREALVQAANKIKIGGN